MGFNLYDLWVSVVYVVGFCHIFGKKGKTFIEVSGFDQFCCSCYGFQTFVVLKGFNLLYRLWVLLYSLWVQSICSTKRFMCIAYDCNPSPHKKFFCLSQVNTLVSIQEMQKCLIFLVRYENQGQKTKKGSILGHFSKNFKCGLCFFG